MKHVVFLVALFTAPAYGFLPERDEYEPLRIETCDIVTSPSIVEDTGCLTVGGEVSFGWGRSSRDGTFGSTSGTIELRATSASTPIASQAIISIEGNEQFPSFPWSEKRSATANVAVGTERWTASVGGLDETALNFTEDRPFGLTLGDLWWGTRSVTPQSGIQMTAEIAPGLEATVERAFRFGEPYYGGSVSLDANALQAHLTLVDFDRDRDQWMVHASTSVIDSSWSALAHIQMQKDDWHALFSGSISLGNATFSGFYALERDAFLPIDVFGVEGSYELTNSLQIAASFSRRNDAWTAQDRVEISAFQKLADAIEGYATLGEDSWSQSGYSRRFVEVGTKYEPTDNISLAVEGYVDTESNWQILAVGSVEF